MASIFSVFGSGSSMFVEGFEAGRDSITNFRNEQRTDHILEEKARQERLIKGIRKSNQNIAKALQGVTNEELAEINMYNEKLGLPLINSVK